MKWFKHDSSARLDAKIQRLVHRHGTNGYAIYWYCLEAVALGIGPDNLSFELEDDAVLVARYFALSVEVVENIMTYMVELGLFEESEGKITCLRMATRTDEYTAKLMRNSNQLRIVSGQAPDSVGTKSEKIPPIRIEEKRREESRGRFTPPTVEQVAEYCKQRGNSVDPEKFVDHYTSNGWKVGRNSMKDWKAAVRTWERTSFGDNKPSTEQEVIY